MWYQSSHLDLSKSECVFPEMSNFSSRENGKSAWELFQTHSDRMQRHSSSHLLIKPPCDWPSGVSIPRPHRASTECSLCPSHSLPHTPPTSGRSRAFARCWQRSRHPCSRSGPLPNVASSPLMKSVAEEHWRVPVALSRLRDA